MSEHIGGELKVVWLTTGGVSAVMRCSCGEGFDGFGDEMIEANEAALRAFHKHKREMSEVEEGKAAKAD